MNTGGKFFHDAPAPRGQQKTLPEAVSYREKRIAKKTSSSLELVIGWESCRNDMKSYGHKRESILNS